MGKLIAHSYPNIPLVIPLYHKGMEGVIPEIVLNVTDSRPSKPVSIIPRTGNTIDVYVGRPINFQDKVRQFDALHPGELKLWKTTLAKIKLYREITDDIRREVLKLEAIAYNRDPSACKYKDEENLLCKVPVVTKLYHDKTSVLKVHAKPALKSFVATALKLMVSSVSYMDNIIGSSNSYVI